MEFFETTNYIKIVKYRVSQYPNNGYGVLRKIAHHLGVNSTLVSQIMSGSKNLNLEQATLVCEFFGFTKLETKYFLLLVQLARAGNEPLRKFLKEQIAEAQAAAGLIANRLPAEVILDDSDRAIFYSRWYYSAVRQLVAIPGNNIDTISKALALPRKVVAEAIEFLLLVGLIKEEGKKLLIGPKSTHLGANSPFVKTHHFNWRSKAMDIFDQDDPLKLHFTSPMTLRKKDAERIRALLLDTIEEVGKIVDASESEEFFCINIDWFRVTRDGEK